MLGSCSDSDSNAAKFAASQLANKAGVSGGFRRKLTRLLQSLLIESFNCGGLEARGVDKLIVDNLDVGVLLGQHDDLICNRRRVGKCGDILANAGEAELDLLRVGTAELSFAFLADYDEVKVGRLVVHAADSSTETRVNTTAETLVGAANDNELLLVLTLEGLGLGGVVDGVGGFAVNAGFGHGSLGTVELGRGDDLHCLCDFLDVADGLETSFDLTEGCVASGICDPVEAILATAHNLSKLFE